MQHFLINPPSPLVLVVSGVHLESSSGGRKVAIWREENFRNDAKELCLQPPKNQQNVNNILGTPSNSTQLQKSFLKF